MVTTRLVPAPARFTRPSVAGRLRALTTETGRTRIEVDRDRESPSSSAVSRGAAALMLLAGAAFDTEGPAAPEVCSLTIAQRDRGLPVVTEQERALG